MGKVIVLTGAASALGRAAALRFARRGDRLVLAARHVQALEETERICREWGIEVLVVPADARSEEQLQKLANLAVQHFGAVDAWVNHVDLSGVAPTQRGNFDGHRLLIESALFGCMYGARAALSVFARQGRGVLINVGAPNGNTEHPFIPACVVSQRGQRGLTEALRIQLADRPHIHICSFEPGAATAPSQQDALARALVKLVDRPRPVVQVPRWAALHSLLRACLPNTYERLLHRQLVRPRAPEPQQLPPEQLHYPLMFAPAPPPPPQVGRGLVSKFRRLSTGVSVS
jgi:NAD(P)-dependent dehydrogenase (short-subunit alcohol dehydrogenase family)